MSDGCYSEGMKASFVQASVRHQQWKGCLLKRYMISLRDWCCWWKCTVVPAKPNKRLPVCAPSSSSRIISSWCQMSHVINTEGVLWSLSVSIFNILLISLDFFFRSRSPNLKSYINQDTFKPACMYMYKQQDTGLGCYTWKLVNTAKVLWWWLLCCHCSLSWVLGLPQGHLLAWHEPGVPVSEGDNSPIPDWHPWP